MRTLTPHELEQGMIIAEAVKTPSGQVLAVAGSQITRQLINQMKLYRVDYAVVEGDAPAGAENTSISNTTADTSATEQASSQPAPKTYIQESKTVKQKVGASAAFMSFQMQYYTILEDMKVVFHDTVYDGKPLVQDALLEKVATLFRTRNTIIELFDMLNNLRSLDDSVYAHSLNVALISRMIGRWLKFEPHDLDILTCAGLFHDIGKILIPDEVLNKSGKLTDEEFALIKSHPKKGYDILKTQDINSHIKKAALMHHERCDGSGYPSGLTEDVIDEYAMIVGIADVYDAMTAARSYRAPLCAFQVISNFEKEGYQKYHTRFIMTFLNQIAATYQSNRVVLNDGRGGKIVMINPHDLSRPIIQFDNNECLDLSQHRDLYIKAII